MRAAGVPLVPGSDGAVGPRRRCAGRAAEAGFPVLLKASAGGGGKGMRLVASEDELEDAFAAASAEAEAAFGDGSLYVEKLVSPARHVEIQVLCDAAGGVLTLGERECSIQRRHQKLIEESPSAALDPETREAMESTVERACDGDRLPQRRHVRVPRRPGRRVLLHRGELPAPGRAPGLGARHRDRHRARADPDRGRRAARVDGSRAAAWARDRDPDQRGGSRARLPARAGDGDAFVPPLGPGVRVDTAVGSGSEIPPVLRLDDREGHRLGRHARRGDRARRARAPRARGRGHPDDARARARRARARRSSASGDYSTSTLAELEGRVPSLAPA